MSSGTKILLAVVTLFVGTLVIYYGVVMPSDEESPPAEDLLVDASVQAPAETPTRTRKADPVTPAATPPVDIDDVTADATRPRESETLQVLPTTTPRTSAPTEPDRGAASNDPASSGAAHAARGSSTPAESPGVGGAAGGATGTPGRTARERDAAAARPATPDRPSRSVPVAPKYTPYTVAEGDTMTSIAEAWFGDHRKWDLIAKANLVDPNRLRIGQVLRLPPKDSVRPPVERGTGADRVVHVVGPGETLSSIAVAHYGDIAQWERIYQANRAAIGVNPDALKVGMQLTIPGTVERTSSATPGR